MASLRPRKRLTCFYCGKRSHLQFDGQKSFDCRYCDATNWLDERGNITDVPSANLEREPPPVQYAIPRSSTRSPSPTLPSDGVAAKDAIFCDRCLRNQHLVTSVLAQYEWPDEPTGPEAAAAERKFWALRKDMEKRYPQMCADCEPKVERGLREASYTARTDHLRRMMDRTRTQRREVKRKGILDVFDTAGRWIWHLGFILQFWWHIAILSLIFSAYYSSADGNSWVSLVLRIASRAGVDKLPHDDRVIRWAINMTMFSLPWNPRFKQTIRGFTTHIVGFKEWYMYQILTLLIRFGCLSISLHSRSTGLPATTMLGAQLVLCLLMVYIRQIAPKSIRTDTTPLFQPKFKPNTPQKIDKNTASRKETNDLGGILDDILQSPAAAPCEPTSSPPQFSHQNGASMSKPSSSSFYNEYAQQNGPNSSFGALNLSNQPISKRVEQTEVQYEEEMDWSPSASQHRAFSTYNPYKVKNTNPRFSDTPIEPKAGPIWYKVPPAPTTPAQRLRNPPMKPIIRESPKEVKENFFQSSTPRGRVEIGSPEAGERPSASNTIFANPKFFAPEPKDDPRDGLTRMFASSFSISPDPEDEETRRKAARRTGGGLSSLFGRLANNTPKSPPTRRQKRTLGRAFELVVLLTALAAWIRTLGAQQSDHEDKSAIAAAALHGLPVSLASLAACLLVSIRLAADLLADEQQQKNMRHGSSKPPQTSVLAPSWANLGWLQVVAALLLMWTVWSSGGGAAGSSEGIRAYGAYGNALFGVVIAHQAWHVFA